MNTSANENVIYYCQNSLCTRKNEFGSVLLKCQKGMSDVYTKYPWSQSYMCSTCGAVLYACSICKPHGNKKNLLTHSRLCRHHKKHNDSQSAKDHVSTKKMKSYKNRTDLWFTISKELQKDIYCTTTASGQCLEMESIESQDATLEKDQEESSLEKDQEESNRYTPFDGQSSDNESIDSQNADIEKDLYDREESIGDI